MGDLKFALTCGTRKKCVDNDHGLHCLPRNELVVWTKHRNELHVVQSAELHLTPFACVGVSLKM